MNMCVMVIAGLALWLSLYYGVFSHVLEGPASKPRPPVCPGQPHTPNQLRKKYPGFFKTPDELNEIIRKGLIGLLRTHRPSSKPGSCLKACPKPMPVPNVWQIPVRRVTRDAGSSGLCDVESLTDNHACCKSVLYPDECVSGYLYQTGEYVRIVQRPDWNLTQSFWVEECCPNPDHPSSCHACTCMLLQRPHRAIVYINGCSREETIMFPTVCKCMNVGS